MALLKVVKQRAREKAIEYQRVYVVYGHPTGNYFEEVYFGQEINAVVGYMLPNGYFEKKQREVY